LGALNCNENTLDLANHNMSLGDESYFKKATQALEMIGSSQIMATSSLGDQISEECGNLLQMHDN
jgi:hypothetical protein